MIRVITPMGLALPSCVFKGGTDRWVPHDVDDDDLPDLDKKGE